MPSSWHKSRTTVSFRPMAPSANRSFAGVIFGLRPPLRPRARAAARPAIVRSPKIGRSYDMHFLPFDPPASNQS